MVNGILNEHRVISELDDSSRIVQELFFPSKLLRVPQKTREILSPVSLIFSQKQVFHSLDNHELTLVIGPPGAGKSFTIAALTIDLISQGKLVLIVSKNSQAGRVIVNNVEQDFNLHLFE